MTPNLRTGLVTLPEVITGDLARKFRRNFALQPARRLRVWIRLQLELDVPVGHCMRVGYSAIVCRRPAPQELPVWSLQC
jgi:hypothetical protein